MTTKSRLIAAVSLTFVTAAFFAGFGPERQRRTALDADNAVLRARIETLDAHERLARLHGQLLNLIDAVVAMNYGDVDGVFVSVR